jgi:hypothetical protein
MLVPGSLRAAQSPKKPKKNPKNHLLQSMMVLPRMTQSKLRLR